MQTPLQIPYGIMNGKLVAPTDVPRGLSSVKCVECDEFLISAQGDIVRPYFRHHSDSVSLCDYTGEGVRHRLAKVALAERIEQALADKAELTVEWRCGCHEESHTGNLIKVATRISVDNEKVGRFTPDLGIFDENRCRAFVEIEQTHANTPDKKAFCEAEDIVIANIYIRDVLDPVAFVRRKPLKIESELCLYVRGTECRCGKPKEANRRGCIACLRRDYGIDIDIAGSYRIKQPRFGTWAAVITDADDKIYTYTGQDDSSDGSQVKMLCGALSLIDRDWKGKYEIRVHSATDLGKALADKMIFSNKSTFIRYWNSLRNNKGTGNIEPERFGRLVKDRPILVGVVQTARLEFEALQNSKIPAIS